MSLRVLVIPEDPTLNGYILKPLIQAVLAECGKPNANVFVLGNPRLEGYAHAVRAIRDELPDRYGFWDLWIFMPDGDCATEQTMRALEEELREKQVSLICCPAKPEVEIYACIAHRDHLADDWSTVRASGAMKETYFAPLLRDHGDARRAGGGRDLLINASLQKMSTVFQLCPELGELRDRCKVLFAEANT